LYKCQATVGLGGFPDTSKLGAAVRGARTSSARLQAEQAGLRRGDKTAAVEDIGWQGGPRGIFGRYRSQSRRLRSSRAASRVATDSATITSGSRRRAATASR